MNKTFKRITSVALTTSTVVWLTGASVFMPVAAAQTSADEIARLQALIQSLSTQLAALSGQTSAPVTGGTSCNFTRSLTVGMTGDDVKCLQRYLNSAGFQIASSGAGSPGNESMYFGSLTKMAAAKWQTANAACVLTPIGLSVGSGYWGSQSIKCYNGMVASTPTTPTTPTTPVVPVATVGGLTVGLAADNPVSANVPKGASEVPYMKFVVSGSGTLTSLTFKRVGLGATADFSSSGIKLYEGSSRLTTGKTLNSTTHEVNFTNLNIAVSGQRTLWLAADMAAAATGGNINAFNLMSVNGQTVSGPNGNQMVVAGATVGSLTIAKQSTVSNPTVGAVQAKVSEFKITAGTTEDIEVRRIVLTNGGSISSGNLMNLTVKQGGNVLAKVANHTGRDLYVLEFTQPFAMLKGQQRTFEVYADVSPLAKSDETIKLYADVTNDVFASGATYHYGVTVTNNFDSTTANHHVLTLKGADVTLTFHGPVTRDIPNKAQDVTLFDFSIASANNVEVKKMIFSNLLTGTSTGEGYNDWKVVDVETGAAISSSVDITDSASTTVNDVFNISAGQTRHFRVTADVDPDNDSSDTIKVVLEAFGASDIKNLDNNQFVAVASIVPNAEIRGNLQTVQSVSLVVSLSGLPASHNIVSGSANQELLGINLRAQNGDVKVTSMTISASSSNGGTEAQLRNDLRTIGIYVDGVLLGTKQNFADDGTVSDLTVSDIDYTIPEGQTKRFVVKADLIATNATKSNIYYAYVNDLSTELTAVDKDGNTLSLSGTVNGSDGTAGSILVTVTTPTLRVTSVTDQDTDADLIVANGERLLGRFDFFAANSGATVTKLMVGVSNNTTASSTSVLAQEVREIRLYKSGSLVASGIPIGSGADAGSVKFEVPNGIFNVASDQTEQFEVRGLINDITGVSGSGDTGSNILAYIAKDNFQMVSGTTSTTTLLGASATGNRQRLYKSVPTITVSAPSSTNLQNGSVDALLFTVAADAAGDVEWSKIEFNVALTSASLTKNSVTLRYGSTNLSLATGTIATTGGQGVIALTTPERITAGSSKTYKLILTMNDAVNGAANTKSSMVTNLKIDETSFDAPTTRVVQENDGDSFVWSDRGVSPHSATSADWHNGYLVKTLPSDSISLTQN